MSQAVQKIPTAINRLPLVGATFLVPFLLLALSPATLASPDEDDGTRLAPLFATQVDRKLDLPEEEQRRYAELLAGTLPVDIHESQYVVLVDRNPYVQALMIYWMAPDRSFHFIGAAPVSTGKPGRFEHFVTPTGVFEHATDNSDFRSKGTRNEFGIRGYGIKGLRVYDFGWQTSSKGWGAGGEGKLRLQMHATDPALLENKVGTPQSEGCIRIPATLNRFIDYYGILDGDYEDGLKKGEAFWVLSKDRAPTPWCGRFLVVVDTERTERPPWSSGHTEREGNQRGKTHVSQERRPSSVSTLLARRP